MSKKKAYKISLYSLFISLFLISCGSVMKNRDETLETKERYINCFYTLDEEELVCSINYDQLDLFNKTGRKLTAYADSGERIELWWKIDWLNRGYFFPQLRFVLIYFNPNGSELLKKGVYIGECRFSRGCNNGRYSGPDVNKNGIPDYFSEIVWDNWDYGYNSEKEDYFDHYRHIYRPQENSYRVLKYSYFYPERCIPPMSSNKEVCNIKEECKPPYKIKEIKVIESKSF